MIVLLGLITTIASCSKEESAKCSKAENVDGCSVNIGTPDVENAALTVEFLDSFYYDANFREWIKISKDNLNGGLTGSSLPVYSSFLNLPPNEAIDLAEDARDQNKNQSSYLPKDFSVIPYIEVKYIKGVDFIYNYVKRDLNGQPVASVTGQMIVKNNRVFLPLVNQMFSNQFYSPTDQIGKRYIHSIAVTAQSTAQQGSTPKRVEFESNLVSPIVDFYVQFSDQAKAFNLENRFNYYYNGADGVPNQEFPFFTLKQTTSPEAVPVKLRFLFKTRPVLKIEQELFFENPVNIDKFKTTGEMELIRGNSYYVQNNSLTSANHFRMKMKVNGEEKNPVDGREIVIENYPALTPWDLDIDFDFRQNAAYSDPQGLPLITPLKPTCQEITNTTYGPIQGIADKRAATQAEGFLALCHPTTNQRLFLSKADLTTTNLSLSDVYYGFFNYVPQEELKDIGGHFNGIRSVKLKLEGCMRVYVQTPTSTDWELKSVTSQACISEGETDTQGWIYFNAEKTYTINDLLTKYEGVPGLKNLIQSFGTKPIQRTPHFKFNGVINNTNHVY